MGVVRYVHRTMESEVVNLWNECCTFDPITTEKFRKQALFDENYDSDLCYVYVENTRIVGFILASKRKFPYLERGLEPEKGWINVLFVDKTYRRRGIGTSLLKTAEKQLIHLGARILILASYSPNYFFAGLDGKNYPESVEFFKRHGYLPHEKHYSMGRNLHGYRISEQTAQKKQLAENKGYTFLPFRYEYSMELLEFLKDEFGGGWKRNALTAMQKYKAEERLFLVLNPKGKICGCANRAIDDNEMRFGPIGIAQDERNHGLGSILLECAMYEMAQKGIYRMFFLTTDEPGKRYYERMGLEVIRTFISYHRRIDDFRP